MIIFTPAELRSLAAKCRAEARRIEKGPISIFAADAVKLFRKQINRTDRKSVRLIKDIHAVIGTNDV